MVPVKEWHRLDTNEITQELKTTNYGLDHEEARKRLSENGFNELTKKKTISKARIFANQFKSFLVILLILAGLLSLYMGVSDPESGHEIDAFVIFVIIILNAIFGFVQEFNAEKAVEALKKLMSPKTTVVRDGKTMIIRAKEIVPGDIVILEEGAKVPADIRLFESVSLRIDESSLTGESTPVSKIIKAMGEVPVADRKNMCFMGTSVSFGRGKGIVVSTGMQTEIGKIAKMIETPKEITPLQKRLSTLGKNIGILTIIISLIVVFGGFLRGYEIFNIIMIGIALAVAAVPEGLPAVVTITLALGVQRMSRRRAIVRRLPAVETLGAVDIICSDKTGTLTENQMTVRKIWTDNKIISVTGRGYSETGNFHILGKIIKPDHYKSLLMLLRCAGLCNNADVKNGKPMGDPTEAALFVAAEKALDIRKLRKHMARLGEVPFSSERKMMSVIYHAGNREGLFFTKGAPEKVLKSCNRILLKGNIVKLTKEIRDDVLKANKNLAGEALRVLGMAYKPAGNGTMAAESEEKNLIFLGLVGMIDPPRKEVLSSLKTCSDAGIKVVMVTGDHEETAKAIAKELGLIVEGDLVLTGEDMKSMTDSELKGNLNGVSVFARVSPGDKVRIVRLLKSMGHTVAMTGDGVNDAPALKRADIGVSMGIRGTDVAKEASDMILADDNFRTVVSAVKEGRAIYDNIKKFVQFLLSSNIAEVMVVFVALLVGLQDPQNVGRIVLPFTAIQLLWINLLTDGLPAVTLGLDPAAPDIMKRKPRSKKENIFTFDFATDILFVGILLCIGVFSLFYYGYVSDGPLKATTMAFTSMVIFEMVILQAIKHEYKSKLMSNKILIGSMALSIILQLAVVYMPQLRDIFNTVALGLVDWVYILIVMGVLVLLVELKYRYLE